MRNPSRKFKSDIYEQLARIGKAVSSPARLELLDLLCQGPRTVEALAQEAGLSVANASQHLKALRAARLVEAEKSGLFVTYKLADDRVCEFFRSLRALAEARLTEIREITRAFLAGRGQGMEPVDRQALIERVKAGTVTVLDVRPAEEYEAAHIPGAVSIPLKELQQRLAELPRSRTIVAYCRGPYCVLSVDAVERLRALGYRVVRMEEGVADWRAMGLPVEAGPSMSASRKRGAGAKGVAHA